MALEKRIGTLEIVWRDDGQSVKGLAVHSHLFTAEGDFVRTVVEPLTAIDDPTVTDLASQWSAAVVAQRDALVAERDALIAERDSLASQVTTLTESGNAMSEQNIALVDQVATLTTERDDARAQLQPLETQVADLQAQLDALLNPPGPDLSTVAGAKQYLASERFTRESGGITVGDQPVTTNRDEMPIWLGMVMDIMFNPGVRAEFEYKPRGGENTVLTAEQVMRCYQCFAWYVNECFAVERRLAGELEAGSPIADVLAEIPAAWPQTAFDWTPPA